MQLCSKYVSALDISALEEAAAARRSLRVYSTNPQTTPREPLTRPKFWLMLASIITCARSLRRRRSDVCRDLK